MIGDNKWKMAFAQLTGLMQHPPSSPDEDDVRRFHSIVAQFEEACGEDLSVFRVSDEEVAPRVTSFQLAPYGGGHGRSTYSKKKFCNAQYFYARLQGLCNFATALQTKPKPTQPERPASGPSTVINLHSPQNAAFNVNSPGASIAQDANNYQAPDFQALLTKLKEFSESEDLSAEHREQIKVDIETIEIQIGSQRPKNSIILECLRSAKVILENAAGTVVASALASYILPTLQRYLS